VFSLFSVGKNLLGMGRAEFPEIQKGGRGREEHVNSTARAEDKKGPSVEEKKKRPHRTCRTETQALAHRGGSSVVQKKRD